CGPRGGRRGGPPPPLKNPPTPPADPIVGLLIAIDRAAADLKRTRRDLLARIAIFVHGTTRALNTPLTRAPPPTNPPLTGAPPQTAFLTTEGHRDILLLREGGRLDPYDNTQPFPRPYVPRALTFEVPERIGADGRVVTLLDEAAVARVAGQLADHRIEAAGVCLLWSIPNPAPELGGE